MVPWQHKSPRSELAVLVAVAAVACAGLAFGRRLELPTQAYEAYIDPGVASTALQAVLAAGVGVLLGLIHRLRRVKDLLRGSKRTRGAPPPSSEGDA